MEKMKQDGTGTVMENVDPGDVYTEMMAAPIEDKVEPDADVALEEAEDEALEESAEESAEEAGEESEGESEDELGLSEEEAAELKESAKAKINKRIGELRHDLTDAKQELAAAAERAEAAELKLGVLQSQMDQVSRGELLKAAGVNPLLAATSADEIHNSEVFWRDVKRGVRQIIDMNQVLDETESGEPVIYQEKNQAGELVGYTKAQMIQRLYEAEDMLETVIPKAKQTFAQRMKYAQAAKEVYPELFDKKSDRSKVLDEAMRLIPGLAALPNAAMYIGDMLLGEQMRDKKVSEVTVGGRTFVLKDGAPAVKPVKKVPKLPVKPVPAGKSPVLKKKVRSGSFDQGAIMSSPDPDAAAQEQYCNIV